MSYSDLADTFRRRAIEFSPLKARVLFDFGDGGAILVDASASPPEIHEETGEADCTIRVTVENLEKLMTGAMNPTLAYTLGRLKIDGSMGLAMKVANLLDE